MPNRKSPLNHHRSLGCTFRHALFGLITLLGCISSGLPTGYSAEPHPNVVILLADDAGWGDYSSSGNPYVKTPHTDSLARDGVSLTNFYVCPVCSPTRAEFLTGRYAFRTGVQGVSSGEERLNGSETTIAQHFQKSGYRTGLFGKWHNGSQGPYHPLARGFDIQFGYTAGHWSEYFNPPLESQGLPVQGQGYIVDLCVDQAIDFIGSTKDQPFFCYVPLTTPHSPWGVPAGYWNRWKDRDVGVVGKEADAVRCVYAMMEQQDDAVGRLLESLDRRKLTKNTIVLYFSDNGPNTIRLNGGMRGRKGGVDEGGLRSVAYLRWPGHIPAGTTQTGVMGAIDLLPTLSALAGLQLQHTQPIDGLDASAALLSATPFTPPRTLFSHWAGKTSLRSQTHRLSDTGGLFDITTDRGQSHDLSAEQPELKSKLSAQLQAFREELRLSQAIAAREVEYLADLSLPWILPAHRAFLAQPPRDQRPFPVGYAALPRTWLPARDGLPYGSVRRSSNAPNSSFFTDWNATDAAIVWPLEILTPGRYTIEIESTSPATAVGSQLELSFRDTKASVTITTAHDPAFDLSQDTIPRPRAESLSKDFRRWQAGTIELPTGRGLLTLRATDVRGTLIIDLKSISLTLQDSARELP
jgi:arylsulfatase A-like enzyme